MELRQARFSEARLTLIEIRRKILVERFGYTDVGWRVQKDSTKYPGGFISCKPPFTKSHAHDKFGRMRNERRFIWKRCDLFSREIWGTLDAADSSN